MWSETEPLWSDGWLRDARAVPSPNFGPRPADTAVSLAVIHSISLPPGEYGGPEIEQLFTNQLDWDAHPYFQSIRGLEVSSHFFIRRDGSFWQFVSCDDRAWHAGASQYKGQSNCNDNSVGIELEGLEGETFEDALCFAFGTMGTSVMFTGSALAIELARQAVAGASISLVGVPETFGRGVAYGEALTDN